MTMRHLVGFAVFCGALGTLGGQGVQAQTPGQIRFAQMLLSREATQIFNQRVNIAQQNRDVFNLRLLENSVSITRRIQRSINQLSRTINRFQNRINTATARLVGLDAQVTSFVSIFPSSSAFPQLAASNSQIIASFVARAPFGIPPASTIQ
jgi:hypothetical protein